MKSIDEIVKNTKRLDWGWKMLRDYLGPEFVSY